MDFTIRALHGPDIPRGFLESMEGLAEVGLTTEEAAQVFHQRLRNSIHTYVALVGDRVIGTASLLVERKFIHKGNHVAHVEDVAVHPSHRKAGVGAALIEHLIAEAKRYGCYKVILNCHERLVPFYEAQGFHRHDVGMRIDI